MIIEKEVSSMIAHLCSKIPHLEWSGPLFYTMEGSLESPENIIIRVKHLILMDIGSQGHTEFVHDIDKMMDVYDQFPEADPTSDKSEGWKIGLIHSHNTMATFFSGEDDEELVDNTEGVGFYLSLVVNNKRERTACLAHELTEQIKSVTKRTFFGIKTPISIEEEEEITSINKIMLDVIDEVPEFKELDERILELDEIRKKNNVAKYPRTHHYTPPGRNHQQEFRFGSEDEEEDIWKGFEEERFPVHVNKQQADKALLNEIDKFFSVLILGNLKLKEKRVLIRPFEAVKAVQTQLDGPNSTITGDEWAEAIIDRFLNYFGEFFPESPIDMAGNLALKLIEELSDERFRDFAFSAKLLNALDKLILDWK